MIFLVDDLLVLLELFLYHLLQGILLLLVKALNDLLLRLPNM
jgi:hypothetical protein